MRPLIFFFLTMSSVQLVTADETPRKIALLVGVSDYFHKNMEDLSYAENDVIAVGKELKRFGFDTQTLTGRDATRQGVSTALEQLIDKTESLESDAIVFLMFSGHGQELKTTRIDRDSGDTTIEETPFFCPRDTIPFDRDSDSLRGKSAAEIAAEFNLISLNRLIANLDERSNSTRNLLVVDACRNNPAKGKSAGITGSTAVNLPRGVSILFAAKSGQKSWEASTENVKQGVMTHYMLKGMRGDAKNRRGQITWSRLVSYVREEVEYDAGRLAGGSDRKQTPHAIINDDSIIVLKQPGPSSGDWPRFRGPNGSGINRDADVPLTWSNTENVRWRVPLSGKGASSPVVFDNKVLVTAYTADGESQKENVRRNVHCFDAESGAKVWTYTSNPVDEDRSPYGGRIGHAANSVVADESGVYAWLGRSGVVALDWKGKLRWKNAVPPRDGSVAPWVDGASLIKHGGLVFCNAGSYSHGLIAFDSRTGRPIWSIHDEELHSNFSTPLIVSTSSGDELVIQMRDRVTSWDPSTGKALWEHPVSSTNRIAASMTQSNGIVFTTNQNSALAIRIGGRGDVSGTSHSLWNVSKARNSIANSPILASGHLAFISSGVLYLHDPANGELIERRRLKLNSRGRAYASLVATARHAFAMFEHGNCVVFDMQDDWKVVSQNELAEDDPHFIATPAILNDSILLRSHQYLYCIGG